MQVSIKLEPITNHDTHVHTLNKAGLRVRVILDPSSKSRTANHPSWAAVPMPGQRITPQRIWGLAGTKPTRCLRFAPEL